MNNSEQAVSKVANFLKLSLRDGLLFCDELDLPLGQIKIRDLRCAVGLLAIME